MRDHSQSINQSINQSIVVIIVMKMTLISMEMKMHAEFILKERKSSNFMTILMKRARLLNLKKDMFRQLLCKLTMAQGLPRHVFFQI